MKLLTRDNVAGDVRQIIKEAYGTIRYFAITHNIDERDVRRGYAKRLRIRRKSNANQSNYRQLTNLLRILGYEIHYEIREIGERHDANRILHINHPAQGVPVHNGRERQRN